jgi:hypothetical protein
VSRPQSIFADFWNIVNTKIRFRELQSELVGFENSISIGQFGTTPPTPNAHPTPRFGTLIVTGYKIVLFSAHHCVHHPIFLGGVTSWKCWFFDTISQHAANVCSDESKSDLEFQQLELSGGGYRFCYLNSHPYFGKSSAIRLFMQI